jgi:adenine-specific DNA-methyltransferase
MAVVDPRLLTFARSMRRDGAPAEIQLWKLLRDRQLNGFKFRRQHPIGPFIADFYCAEARLVIELDGDSHEERVAYDLKRTAFLEAQANRVLRVVNTDVFDHIESVLMAILEACEGEEPSP